MVIRGGSLGLAVLLVTLAGCALEGVPLKPPTSGLKTPIPGGNQRRVTVAVPFADARQITNRCGMQMGGYGNETANALCQGPELGFRHGYPAVVAWRPDR
jgi:predicted small lipoprotein YifL